MNVVDGVNLEGTLGARSECATLLVGRDPEVVTARIAAVTTGTNALYLLKVKQKDDWAGK